MTVATGLRGVKGEGYLIEVVFMLGRCETPISNAVISCFPVSSKTTRSPPLVKYLIDPVESQRERERE